jgi:type VI secretion system protein ImpC
MAGPSSIRLGDIQLLSGMRGETARLDPDTPFRILILGDFRGESRNAAKPFAQRRPVAVDRDNVDEVLAKFAPQITIPIGPTRAPVTLRFHEIDDFEPDRIYDRLDVFASFGALRKQLQNPATFAGAAEAIRGWVGADAPPSLSPTPTSNAAVEIAIAEILGDTRNATPRSPQRSEWDDFLHRIAGPHLIAAADPGLADYQHVLEEAISALMRAVLHHADFQALEALWRGIAFLARRLETDAFLSIHLLDATRDELAADMAVDDLDKLILYEQVVTRTVGTSGGQPWAVVVGHYTLGATVADLELLANVAQISQATGTSFIAGADARLVGCPSLHASPDIDDWQPDEAVSAAWQRLRSLPAAKYLALAMPRFLLRLPFGKRGNRTERFDFDEMPKGSPHESLLWGNSALVCATLLGQAFSADGWNLDPSRTAELSGLPIHVYEDEGERRAKPCGEIAFRDKALEHIVDSGLIAILSQSASDRVRVARMQSIAATPLAGRWRDR